MSCCGPKASTSAQQARPTSQATETPKGEAAGCCGGAKEERKTPASAPQEAAAHSEGCHAHDR